MLTSLSNNFQFLAGDGTVGGEAWSVTDCGNVEFSP